MKRHSMWLFVFLLPQCCQGMAGRGWFLSHAACATHHIDADTRKHPPKAIPLIEQSLSDDSAQGRKRAIQHLLYYEFRTHIDATCSKDRSVMTALQALIIFPLRFPDAFKKIPQEIPQKKFVRIAREELQGIQDDFEMGTLSGPQWLKPYATDYLRNPGEELFVPMAQCKTNRMRELERLRRIYEIRGE